MAAPQALAVLLRLNSLKIPQTRQTVEHTLQANGLLHSREAYRFINLIASGIAT
jgi:hypothetical protein